VFIVLSRFQTTGLILGTVLSMGEQKWPKLELLAPVMYPQFCANPCVEYSRRADAWAAALLSCPDKKVRAESWRQIVMDPALATTLAQRGIVPAPAEAARVVAWMARECPGSMFRVRSVWRMSPEQASETVLALAEKEEHATLLEVLLEYGLSARVARHPAVLRALAALDGTGSMADAVARDALSYLRVMSARGTWDPRAATAADVAGARSVAMLRWLARRTGCALLVEACANNLVALARTDERPLLWLRKTNVRIAVLGGHIARRLQNMGAGYVTNAPQRVRYLWLLIKMLRSCGGEMSGVARDAAGYGRVDIIRWLAEKGVALDFVSVLKANIFDAGSDEMFDYLREARWAARLSSETLERLLVNNPRPSAAMLDCMLAKGLSMRAAQTFLGKIPRVWKHARESFTEAAIERGIDGALTEMETPWPWVKKKIMAARMRRVLLLVMSAKRRRMRRPPAELWEWLFREFAQ